MSVFELVSILINSAIYRSVIFLYDHLQEVGSKLLGPGSAINQTMVIKEIVVISPCQERLTSPAMATKITEKLAPQLRQHVLSSMENVKNRVGAEHMYKGEANNQWERKSNNQVWRDENPNGEQRTRIYESAICSWGMGGGSTSNGPVFRNGNTAPVFRNGNTAQPAQQEEVDNHCQAQSKQS